MSNHTLEANSGTKIRSSPAIRDLTMVFTDIEASTQKVEALGDAEWYRLAASHHRIIRRRVREFGGSEASAMGDGFLLVFESFEPALSCMEAVQHDIRAFVERHPEYEIHVRMGIHTGETIVAPDGSLFGRNVHMAARVSQAANGDEILVSEDTLDLATAACPQRSFGDARRVALRGLDGIHTLRVAEWE